MRKSKIFFYTSLILLLGTVSWFFVSNIFYFPDTVHLLAGQENRLDFGLPYSAVIKSDPESVAVISVNDKPVEDNIEIALNSGVSVSSRDETSMNMVVSVFGIPVKNVGVDVIPDTEVVPCGITVGVRINTNGIMVLGTGVVNGRDGKARKPSEGILKSGDIIISLDGIELESKEQLIRLVAESERETVNLRIKRNEQILNAEIKPALADDGVRRIGVWVRDSTKGIGTVTYYNPQNKKFGALGHGILDVDTKKLMTVKTGEIMKTEIVSVKKGKKGGPGELIGNIHSSKVLGTIKSNTDLGLYGTINDSAEGLPSERIHIALQGDVHEGPAVILSNVYGDEAKRYDVYIESVNRYSSDDSKGMVVRVTDPGLITKTNGIVQGMSGSPIIQDGRLIGAITHVFVQNPAKGYGIFIENMIKQEKKI